MARTAITIHNLAGAKGLANGILVTTAGDVPNDNDWLLRDGDILFARNGGAGVQVLTLITSADEDGRVETIANSQAVGTTYLYGPLDRVGYAQSDGKCRVDIADTLWDLAVIRNVGN